MMITAADLVETGALEGEYYHSLGPGFLGRKIVSLTVSTPTAEGQGRVDPTTGELSTAPVIVLRAAFNHTAYLFPHSPVWISDGEYGNPETYTR